jgi:hypothetical protein
MRDPRFPPPISYQMADRLLERYLLWRQATAAVQLTYRTWTHGPPENAARAYADYCEALDEEERSATEYHDCLRQADRLGAA